METKPLWSSQRNKQRYRFEVMPQERDEYGDLEHCADSVVDYSTVACHICNINVPTKYIKEHKNSEKHKICMKIVDTALQRTRDNMLKATLTSHTGPVAGYFCEPCSVIVTNENHETSPIHKSSLLHDKLLNDLIMIYSDKDNINNVELKYLTVSMNNDIDKNSSIKYSTECQSNDLVGDNINNELNSENKDTASSDKVKYPKDYTTKDCTTNELKCSNDSGSKDLESNNERSYVSESIIKGPESNKIKYLTDKDNYLENCKQITYEIDWENKCIENDVKLKNKVTKEEDTTDDAIKEQIVHKHTKIITDLNSMESYFKVLMEIFSQKSLIYVYINRLVVGINIGDLTLKVHVDNFLGINGEYNMCLLCSCKFTDREEHIYNYEHMKKVMAPIKDHNCIRQVNKISFYCLLCACLIVRNDKYPDNIENIREKVTAHVKSKDHNTNFNKALHYKTSKNREVDLKFTSKTFFDDNICDVCGLFVSVAAIKDRNTGNINNSKYREHFCSKSRKCRRKYNSEISDYKLHLKHAIRTYCGACDLYVDTRYLDSHTTSKTHKEKIACDAHLKKLTLTKSDVIQKTVFTDRSERHLWSIASEVLEDLLWAQMKISKNPKEVICKICNVVVSKALKDVQDHIKGENHQRYFANLLLSCNTNNIYTGLEQIYLQTELKTKVEYAKCEICNTSISNTQEHINVHVNDMCHQNKLKELFASNAKCNVIEQNKSQAKINNQANRSKKPVKVSSRIGYAAVTANKGKEIPIKDITNNKTNEKDKTSVDAQADVKQISRIDNSEGTVVKPPYSTQNTTNYMNPSNTSVALTKVQSIQNNKTNEKDTAPVDAQADVKQISRIDNSERIVANPPCPMQNTTNYMNPSSTIAATAKVQSIQNRNKRNKNASKNNIVRVLRPPVNLERDSRHANAQVEGSHETSNMDSERISQNVIQSTSNEDPQINLCHVDMKSVNKMRHLIQKSSRLKQNHCVVCKTNFPLSDSHVADHLLGKTHEKNYRFLLSSNRITEQKTGRNKSKFRCSLCCYDIMNQMCVLIHIEGIIHQEKMKRSNPLSAHIDRCLNSTTFQ